MWRQSLIVYISLTINFSDCYKILSIFPYNGRSHHIYFSSIVEELASRGHDVTVINYHPVKEMSHLRQISLRTDNDNTSDSVDMEARLRKIPKWFKIFYSAYHTAQAFKFIANTNCEKLINNKEIQNIVESNEKFDVVIVEQFVTDCGLALAHKLGAPTVGMTAHILMPWTYSRLGAINHPAFVPNHFFGTGTKPDLLTKTKSALINSFFNLYYAFVIQKSDHEIIKRVYPESPDLEDLGNNISLLLLNQYFPLTGSRLYGANVIEVGGMHIKQENKISDKELEMFLNSAEEGVVYISFGSVSKNLPSKILKEIILCLEKSNKKFIWKVDDVNMKVLKNTVLKKWFPQPAILCHPKTVAFITHSGMLSSAEAMHCGVPIVSVPIFGDQFANAAAAVDNGLGVTVDLATLDENILKEALDTVLQKRYQKRAKQLSELWKSRPLSPMDTAVFWIEYIAKHKECDHLKPPTVQLPFYQYLLLDVILLLVSMLGLTVFIIVKVLALIKKFLTKKNKSQKKKRN